ncbi:MAG: hypothetical protein HQL28_03885 [Candidatus Omnitrophica bacterium]|nr:hypothetical protein [Candidatus Omnitrophota bacterium]
MRYLRNKNVFTLLIGVVVSIFHLFSVCALPCRAFAQDQAEGQDKTVSESKEPGVPPDVASMMEKARERIREIELLKKEGKTEKGKDVKIAEEQNINPGQAAPQTQTPPKEKKKLFNFFVRPKQAKPRAAKVPRPETKSMSLVARAKEERNRKLAEKYLAKSRKYLEKCKYPDARTAVYKADKFEHREENKKFKLGIDQEEIYSNIHNENGARLKNMAIAAKKYDPDVVAKNREHKNWLKNLMSVFGGEKYALGEIYDGETYNIEQCVQLAMARSSRMEFADSQVSLAKVKVMAAYRKLFPTLTASYKDSSGRIAASGYLRH